MGKIKAYIRDVMQDRDGSPSSKRLVTIIATLLVCVGYVANLFWGYTVEEFMFTSMMYIVIAGLGFTGAEKFAPKSLPSNTSE